jgi:hypothetical protein
MFKSALFPITAALLFSACAGEKGDNEVATTVGDSTSTSMSANAASQRGTSMVRFVNALPGSAPLTVMADSVGLFENVAFSSVTPYQEVRDNFVKFSASGGGSRAELAANRESMRDGGRYTMVAMSDRDGGIMLSISRDDLVPDSGKARIRVIHAAPGLDDIALGLVGSRDNIIDDVDYGADITSKDVVPVASGFVVRRDDNGRTLATLKRMSLQAGSTYTFVLAAKPSGALTPIAFTDSLVAATPAAMR